ncbi:hypothetical protein I317_07902 [Kwoniella heveanensis CBS 569]|nr:hypothetical protein I317_07902 [Kwoniella heveanensis CBS 569]
MSMSSPSKEGPSSDPLALKSEDENGGIYRPIITIESSDEDDRPMKRNPKGKTRAPSSRSPMQEVGEMEGEEERDEREIEDVRRSAFEFLTAPLRHDGSGNSSRIHSHSRSARNSASGSIFGSIRPSNRRPMTPMVEIPLLPLSDIIQYAHSAGPSSIPNSRSRSLLPGIHSASEGSSRSASVNPAVNSEKNRGWRVDSSPEYDHDGGEGEEEVLSEDRDDRWSGADSGMELSTESDSGIDSDSDLVRRSGRENRKQTKKEGKISTRTRAKHPVVSRSTLINSLSSDSDSQSESYADRPRKKGRSSEMARTHRKEHPRRAQRRNEDPLLSSSPSGSTSRRTDADGSYAEEIDQLDEEDEDSGSDWHSERRGGKKRKKGKGIAKAHKAEVHEDVVYNHRPVCEKCSREPADDMLERAKAKKSKSKGKRRRKDDDEISDEELAGKLEGWLECKICTNSIHWGCLTPSQKKDVLWALLDQEGPPLGGAKPRRSVKIDESFEYTCARCTLNPRCFVCHEGGGMSTEEEKKENGTSEGGADEDTKGDHKMDIDKKDEEEKPPMFRCLRCKQCVHYEHLEVPRSLGDTPPLKEVANHYQIRSDEGEAWFCHQCRGWIWTVDIIIAWRPAPAEAVEPALDEDEKANWKDALPREYLVKWTNRGFRHVTWVPHAWLQITSAAKLRNFLEKGPSLDLVTDETLAARGDEMEQPTIANVTAEEDRSAMKRNLSRDDDGKKEEPWTGIGPGPEKDAEASLPIEWSTVDRVLDIMLLLPSTTKVKAKPVQRRGQRIMSVSLSAAGSTRGSPAPDAQDQGDSKEAKALNPAEVMREKLGLKDGAQPPKDIMVDIDSWEEHTGRELDESDVDEISELAMWCFVKWDDLQYDQSTWDSPPPTSSSLYPAFKRALARYLQARRVEIPVLTPSACKRRDEGAARIYVPPTEQPDCIVGGKLMTFQMEGFQWLLYKHFKRESCILADDMGLGKTIQIASVLGYLGSSTYNIYPCLVVVPNSTITNWVREFEKWVPHMRVVPYYGESASRKIISKYELYHKGEQWKAEGLKAHVVLTTYDMITGAEFRVFRGIPRWEVLCIDEGQRLKSDGSLIFNRLKTLNTVHRVLLTGTPLNNNLRELFNLLNFLDPSTFSDLLDLEKRFENLNETLVQELHEMIKPYILRRIKADVLKLPPKIEIIVPISLSPLQKQVYKGVFERNADLIQAILLARQKRLRAPVAVASAAGSEIGTGSTGGDAA